MAFFATERGSPFSALLAALASTLLGVCWLASGPVVAAPADLPPLTTASANRIEALNDFLSPADWRRVDQSVDRALAWLATQQQPDGSFPAWDRAQPAITSLAVLAFMSRGHIPGEGRYGQMLNKAIAYAVSCQKEDGLLSFPKVASYMRGAASPEHTASYSHPITGLMLVEACGMTGRVRGSQGDTVIQRAIDYSLRLSVVPKSVEDRGGWRYIRPWQGSGSDLSVTSWHLMFLRAAKNAGFSIPSEPIDKALAYVQRCALPDGQFYYGLSQMDRKPSPAMVGAGVLSMSLGGRHGTASAIKGGDWILKYNTPGYFEGFRFYYNCFYCTQAMHQLGGERWSRYYPQVLRLLSSRQQPDGSWQSVEHEEQFWGPVMTTSFGVLVLATPYELLPIFQR